jgi:hypothetical protein
LPFNGTGTFQRKYNWVSDRNTNIPITATRFDDHDNDLASGLSACVTRDGQGSPTNDMNMNSHKITNLANPVNPQDAMTMATADARYLTVAGTKYLPLTGGTLTGPLIGTTCSFSGTGTISGAFTTAAITCTTVNASGIVRCTGAHVIAQGAGGNPSLSMYDTSQGVANILFTGGSNTVYLGNSDGNGNYAGTWYQLWAGVNSSIAGNLTVNGAFNTNGITGTTITGTAMVASSSVSINVAGGQNALIWYYVSGVRQYYAGCLSNGTYTVTDQTGGVARLVIDTTGHAVFANNLSCNGAFNTNGITCTTINTQGSTITAGPVNCGAISATTINSNGNTITGGPVNCGAISCTTITTNGNTITSGEVDSSGNISAAGDLFCNNGVQYNGRGAHNIGFNNSGTTLTFYALGGSSGSWNFTGSDERLKDNIAAARGDALAELARLKLISFDMPFPDIPTRHFDCGFSAQDIHKLIPEAVTEIEHADGKEQLVLDTLPLLARCVSAIQQLLARMEALESR